MNDSKTPARADDAGKTAATAKTNRPRRHRFFGLARTGLGAAAALSLLPALLAGCGGGSGTNDQFSNRPPNAATTFFLYSGTLQRADSQMSSVLGRYLGLNVPPLYTLTPQQARQQPSIADAVRILLQDQEKSTAPEAVASVRDTSVPGPAGAIPVRVYTPIRTSGSGSGQAAPLPVIVYYHGGGWVIATIDTYDASARALANAAQAVVVSVEYRKGPENKFPAAHEDSYAALQYVIANAATFGGDPARVATAGESAGGNLAVAVALMARDRGGRLPVAIASVYPIADTNVNRPSYVENADALPLNRPLMQYFFANYLNGPQDYSNPLISLVSANLSGLPPTTIITAEIDPLRSEGQELAQRLQRANVSVRSRDYQGVTHEFFGTGAVVDKARDAVSFAAQGLRDGFNN